MNITLNVFAILHSRHQKRFRSLQQSIDWGVQDEFWSHLIHFRPEALFQLILSFVHFLIDLLLQIHVCQHAHDSRQSVHLSDVQEFERFHFETEFHIDQK